MSSKIMALVIATMVAGSASSAFAAGSYQHKQPHRAQIERYSDPQLFEGRNSAPQSDYSAGATSTGRDAMVEELGN
jgi:hypothetical protein